MNTADLLGTQHLDLPNDRLIRVVEVLPNYGADKYVRVETWDRDQEQWTNQRTVLADTVLENYDPLPKEDYIMTDDTLSADESPVEDPTTPVGSSPRDAILAAASELIEAAFILGQTAALNPGTDLTEQRAQTVAVFTARLDGVLTDGPVAPGFYSAEGTENVYLRDRNGQWWAITDTAFMMQCDWPYIQQTADIVSLTLIVPISD